MRCDEVVTLLSKLHYWFLAVTITSMSVLQDICFWILKFMWWYLWRSNWFEYHILVLLVIVQGIIKHSQIENENQPYHISWLCALTKTWIYAIFDCMLQKSAWRNSYHREICFQNHQACPINLSLDVQTCHVLESHAHHRRQHRHPIFLSMSFRVCWFTLWQKIN